ncbi:MAG: hypothetical protein ACLVJ8_14805 [Ruthenibacterium lactatiformans]
MKSGGPVLMPMAQKERQREAQQRTAQQFQQFGMDPTAIVGQQIGQWAGDVLHRKAAETGIDPGKSKAAYIAEKALGGAATSVDGTYNNILDNARAQVNAQLTNGYVTDTGVNLRDMQNFGRRCSAEACAVCPGHAGGGQSRGGAASRCRRPHAQHQSGGVCAGAG